MLQAIGFILVLLGMFLVAGNEIGFFETFSFAGFFTGSVGVVLVTADVIWSRRRWIDGMRSFNQETILKRGPVKLVIDKKTSADGGLFLTPSGLGFVDYQQTTSFIIPFGKIRALEARKSIGLIENLLHLQAQNGASYVFTLSKPSAWVAAAQAAQRKAG